MIMHIPALVPYLDAVDDKQVYVESVAYRDPRDVR